MMALIATLAGAALGWLAALSRSPVVLTLVPALLAAAVGAVPVIRAARAAPPVRPEDVPRADFSLVALLVIGVAMGASAGARAVGAGWFAPSVVPWVERAQQLPQELRLDYLRAHVVGTAGDAGATTRAARPLEAGGAIDLPCARANELVLHEPAPADLVARLRAAFAERPRVLELLDTSLTADKARALVHGVCP